MVEYLNLNSQYLLKKKMLAGYLTHHTHPPSEAPTIGHMTIN